jgi:LysM repeat protein
MEQRIDFLQSQLNTMQRIAEREQEPKKQAVVRPYISSRTEKEKPAQRKILNKGMDAKQKYGGTLKRETKKIGPVYHVVRQGDTFYSICRLYGISLQKLGELNHFDEKAEIYPGQKIIVGP